MDTCRSVMWPLFPVRAAVKESPDSCRRVSLRGSNPPAGMLKLAYGVEGPCEAMLLCPM